MNRFKLCQISGVAGIVAMLGWMTPALAAVTTAQLTASSPNSNGPCPFTETFTGSISGTSGASFQYSFNRIINGAQQVQNVGVATIPSSGSLAVSDSFSINATTVGVNFDQIWVHNIVGGQGDVYSPRAPFNVNCVAPGPGGGSAPSHVLTAGAGGHSAVQLVYGVPPPFNLASTTDPHVCGQHGGLAGVFCIQAVPDRYLILIWDWQPNDKWPSIDGYHIYDVTGGGKTRVQDQTNPQATVEFFKPGSFTNKCYAVSAYKGASESPISASFCAAVASVGLKTLTISASAAGSRHEEYVYGKADGPTECSAPCVGYQYFKEIALGVIMAHANVIRRGYISFGSSGATFGGLNVAKATMRVTRDASVYDGGHYLNSLACLGAVGAATADWTTSRAFANGDFGYDVLWSLSGDQATFDVSRIVRDWATGARPNYGFVLKGKSEELGSDANDICELTLLPNATLTVDYYP